MTHINITEDLLLLELLYYLLYKFYCINSVEVHVLLSREQIFPTISEAWKYCLLQQTNKITITNTFFTKPFKTTTKRYSWPSFRNCIVSSSFNSSTSPRKLYFPFQGSLSFVYCRYLKKNVKDYLRNNSLNILLLIRYSLH